MRRISFEGIQSCLHSLREQDGSIFRAMYSRRVSQLSDGFTQRQAREPLPTYQVTVHASSITREASCNLHVQKEKNIEEKYGSSDAYRGLISSSFPTSCARKDRCEEGSIETRDVVDSTWI